MKKKRFTLIWHDRSGETYTLPVVKVKYGTSSMYLTARMDWDKQGMILDCQGLTLKMDGEVIAIREFPVELPMRFIMVPTGSITVKWNFSVSQ